MICLTDKKVICSDCVLFGDHKNHKYEKILHFRKVVEDMLQTMSDKKLKVSEILNKAETKEKLTILVKNKKTEL